MHYERLKKLLAEWDLYSSKETQTPSRIMNLEKWSIPRSVEITIDDMRKNGELNKISEKEKAKIDIIFNYIKIMA